MLSKSLSLYVCVYTHTETHTHILTHNGTWDQANFKNGMQARDISVVWGPFKLLGGWLVVFRECLGFKGCQLCECGLLRCSPGLIICMWLWLLHLHCCPFNFSSVICRTVLFMFSAILSTVWNSPSLWVFPCYRYSSTQYKLSQIHKGIKVSNDSHVYWLTDPHRHPYEE